MTVRKHMSTNVDPKDLSYLDLNNICSDSHIKPDYQGRCYDEMAIRHLVGSSIEEGKHHLNRFMDIWEASDKSTLVTDNALLVINASIERAGQRKGLLTPLNAAKKKLEKML